MKIGFDARPISDRPVGVGIYIINLINFLIKNKIYCFLFFEKKPVFKLPKSEYLKKIVIGDSKENTPANRLFWEQIMLPYYLKQYKIDLYHATDSKGAPLDSLCPVVLTVHDLIPWLTPKFHSLFEKELFYKFSVRNSCKIAKKIITVSSYTKQDLINVLKIKGDKIKVVYNGMNLDFKKPSSKEIADSHALLGIKGKYVVYVGGIDKRKNIEGLIKAFVVLKNKFNDLKLVIIGRKINNFLSLEKMVRNLKIEKDVIFTGYVDDKIKYALIFGAKALVYPSFFEGFGFPVLEGMMCGVPVVTSNTSSIPEVAGNSAVLVNPHSYKIIAEGVDRILSNEKFAQSLIRKGLRRVKKFSLQNMGQATLDTYKKILNGIL